MRGAMLRLISTAVVVAALCCPAPASAQVETIGLVAVAGTGCDDDQFHVTVARANLDGNPYYVHFVASVSGHVYTNQSVSVSTDGSSDFYIYSSFSAGPVSNQGLFPMPSGQPIQIDVALERPFGKVLTSRRMVVDGCNTGNVLSNGPPPVPTPQHETLKVVGVDGLGCNNDVFNVTVQAAGLDNAPYTMRAVATVDGLVYMNGHSSFVADDSRLQYVYGTFSYGAVANEGTYPMPAGRPLQLDLTLERPAGTVLYAWRLVVDGCDTGNVTFSSALKLAGPAPAPVPALPPAGLAVLSALVGVAFAWRRRAKRRF